MRKSRKMMLSERLELFNILQILFFTAYKQFHKLHAETAHKQKDDDACSCHGKITDQCTTDYPESVSGTNFKRTTGNYRKEYLQDVHSDKTKNSPYSFVIDPDTELFGIRYKMNQRTPDKISDQDYKTMVMIASIRLICFVFFSL